MRKRGFTLVELLVVVAIITILAATVVPRVQNWISKSRMARALSEIKGADLALTKMLTDADRKNFSQFFDPSVGMSLYNAAMTFGAYKVYNDVFYELLRRGRDADLSDYNLQLYPSIKKKLGTMYMDLGTDPWGDNTYQFLPGPITFFSAPNPSWTAANNLQAARGIYGLRCYRPGPAEGVEYVYDAAARAEANEKMRGNPKWDMGNGMPASFDLPVYIWSCGEDMISDQWFGPQSGTKELHTGYDDINNWDSGSGWAEFYQ